MGVFLPHSHLTEKNRVLHVNLSLSHTQPLCDARSRQATRKRRNEMKRVNDRRGSSPCRKSRRVGASCGTLDAVEKVRHHHSAGSRDGGAVVQEVGRRKVRGDVAFAVVSVRSVGACFFARRGMTTGFFYTMLCSTAYTAVVPETVTSVHLGLEKIGSFTSSRAKETTTTHP